jgi:2,4-dienoyl-CoA reductase-like NADH-dependent reductase (Old Yellow Enzyme family)
MPTLFDPITLGAIEAPNRILMAPMTRARGTRDHVPTPMMADYYAQRASAGLIISEAIGITQQDLGWPYATGLWSAEQIAGWRRVTDTVHDAGGRIIAQLWPVRHPLGVRQIPGAWFGDLAHQSDHRLKRAQDFIGISSTISPEAFRRNLCRRRAASRLRASTRAEKAIAKYR